MVEKRREREGKEKRKVATWTSIPPRPTTFSAAAADEDE